MIPLIPNDASLIKPELEPIQELKSNKKIH